MSNLTRRKVLATTALAGLFGKALPLMAEDQQPLSWRNWSGGLVSNPAGRFVPASEEELARFLSSTKGAIRPVGSGHSFSALVPTEGHLIVIDELQGLLGHDVDQKLATFAAGTRLGDMGAPLEQLDQAMFNLPDIDRQTLAGAISTATHGTGIDFGCLSAYVTALRLITPGGEVLDLDEQTNSDLFNAARVSLGALGIITRVTMQNCDSFRLKAKSWIQPIDDVLENFDGSAAKHRHFEMFPLVHSDYAIVLAIDETSDPINNPLPTPEEDAAFGAIMKVWSLLPPKFRKPAVNLVAKQIEPTEAVDVSYKILSNVRNNRFNEMEYAIPLDAGAECLREVLGTIADKEIDVVFPLEYRYVRRDNTWLSMSSGNEDHAAISVHRTADKDYRPYFDLIEPIFWKYGGRPHWGKIHTLDAKALSRLYPHYRDFQELRASMDPRGRMLNSHLKKLFL